MATICPLREARDTRTGSRSTGNRAVTPGRAAYAASSAQSGRASCRLPGATRRSAPTWNVAWSCCEAVQVHV